MKATIHCWSGPSEPSGLNETEDIVITVYLPFVPQIGMTLKITPEGDFYCVESLAWDIATPDEITVFLEEPVEGALEPWAVMREQGWRIL